MQPVFRFVFDSDKFRDQLTHTKNGITTESLKSVQFHIGPTFIRFYKILSSGKNMNLVTAKAAIRYLALIGICGVCFYCCKYVSSKKNLQEEVKKKDLTFLEMLQKHSSPNDKLIILAMTDYAFADMAVNMYETSFKRHGITNFLFVGAGQKSCEVLITKYSLPCFHYANDSSANVASVFQSSDFNRKMNIRTYMIIDALQAGYTVLHTDTDIVFLKNPLPEIKVRFFVLIDESVWEN